MPAKARTRFAAEPDNAPLVVLSVIAPVVSALIVTSCARVGASAMVTVPVCSVTVPAKALTKSAELPE